MGKRQLDKDLMYIEWGKDLGISCGGYNSGIDKDILLHLKQCIEQEDLVFAHDKYTELIKYILCSKDYMDYGGSPRGAWITDEGIKFYNKYKYLLEDLSDVEWMD